MLSASVPLGTVLNLSSLSLYLLTGRPVLSDLGPSLCLSFSEPDTTESRYLRRWERRDCLLNSLNRKWRRCH